MPFPKVLLRALPRLYPGDDAAKQLAVILSIVDFRRPNLTRSPSVEYLAFLAGLSTEGFKEALGKLEAKGWLRVQEADGGLNVTTDNLTTAIRKNAPDDG